MARSSSPAVSPVLLVRGEDPSLRGAEVRRLIHAASCGEDLSLGLDDFATEDYDLAGVVQAAQTPPMFTARRVVVAREVGRFTTDHVEPLLSYLSAPCPTTTLILVAGGGQISRKLLDAVKRTGELIETGVPTGKARQAWLTERLSRGPVRLDARAANRLGEHLGDDLSRIDGILTVLAAVHGDGARLGTDDLEPFLGSAGSGAPWDLTDAIDRGDIVAALSQLGRNLGAGERHPLQLMASLQAHFGRMLRLDGSGAHDENEAATMLGLTGSTFPAKKALTQARKLGGDNIHKAIALLATADMDLRGVRDLPGETVMELLVARLTRLSASRR